jgi:hypothetical protein
MNTVGKLQVKEINHKSAKFLYEIVDIQTNKVVSTRKSNRVYVAATFDGQNYFGRVELALKYVRQYPARIICYTELAK